MHRRTRLDLAARLLDGGQDLVSGQHTVEPRGQSLYRVGVRRLVMHFHVLTGHCATFRLPQARAQRATPTLAAAIHGPPRVVGKVGKVMSSAGSVGLGGEDRAGEELGPGIRPRGAAQIQSRLLKTVYSVTLTKAIRTSANG